MRKTDVVSNGVIDIETVDKAQEKALFAAIRHGNGKLKGQLTQGALIAAREITSEFESNEIGFDELYPEAVVAVHEAINDFDCEKEEQFCDYLKRRIEKCLQKCFSNLPWMLPIDHRILQLHDKYEMALLELYSSSDEEYLDSHDEIAVAEHLDISVDELRNMLNEYSMCRIESLNKPIVLDEPAFDDIDNTVDFIETIVDPKTENQAAAYLADLMDDLSSDEKYVICAREGVLSTTARTDEQIAYKLGLDVNDIELLYQSAIGKIKNASARI